MLEGKVELKLEAIEQDLENIEGLIVLCQSFNEYYAWFVILEKSFCIYLEAMHYRELFIGVLSTLEAASHVLLEQIDSWQLTLKSFKESQYLFGHGLIFLAFSIEDVLKQSSPKTSLEVVSVDE